MLRGIDLSLSKHAQCLTRRDLCILIGLLTKHVDLNRHLKEYDKNNYLRKIIHDI